MAVYALENKNMVSPFKDLNLDENNKLINSVNYTVYGPGSIEELTLEIKLNSVELMENVEHGFYIESYSGEVNVGDQFYSKATTSSIYFTLLNPGALSKKINVNAILMMGSANGNGTSIISGEFSTSISEKTLVGNGYCNNFSLGIFDDCAISVLLFFTW